MICTARSILIMSIIDAIVVDLPLPVGPVTRISPEWRRVSSARIGGSFNDSSDGITLGITRIAAPTEPRCL